MRNIFCLLLLTLCGLPPEVFAEDDVPMAKFADRTFTARVGAYSIGSLTKMRIDDSTGTLGTTITLEDDLNMDSESSTFYAGVDWRMVGRHYLELEYFSFNRSGLATLSSVIEFGDREFEIGATVDSFFDTEVARVSYSYLLFDKPRWALALSAGIHVTDLATGINEVAPIGGPGERDVAFADVTAPLPVIGVNVGYQFTEKLSMRGRFQLFRLEFGDYKGALDHAAIKLEYDAFKHVGLGIGYDLFSLDLDVNRERWNGRVDFRFDGPLIYVLGLFK